MRRHVRELTAVQGGDEMYARHSLGFNLNPWWGIAMLIFGAGMLLLARKGRIVK
jgi:hypothetical protein